MARRMALARGVAWCGAVAVVIGSLGVGVGVVGGMAGCAGSGRPFRPAMAPEGESVLYIFRRGGPLQGGPVTIVINQEEIGEIGRGEYIAYAARPGEHLVRVEGGSSTAARVQLGANESAFLEVVTGALGEKPDLEVRLEEEAMEMLAETREATELRRLEE